jgi:hypothetical protein
MQIPEVLQIIRQNQLFRFMCGHSSKEDDEFEFSAKLLTANLGRLPQD